MTKQFKEIVISKDKAVFWLDSHGRWHNKHGQFEHRKIIDFFHSSIRKDKDGYFVAQATESYLEKVYFRYEDTAIFVFNVIKNESIFLLLNTKKQIKLNPEELYIKDDYLYTWDEEDLVKFNEQSMMKISKYMENDNEVYFINLNDKRYKIRTLG
ncbi:MAG: MFS transporter permease [Desulfobacterales bacterium]|nr:MFS transporter permease [Deltaproteobacteria bacterium]NNL42387.1 MFS transporter permease [Desulfobacterales bacterium]